MLGTIALTLAAFMIPTAPLNALSPETYSEHGAPTAYVQQANVQKGKIYTQNGTEVDVKYYDNAITDNNLDYYTYLFDGKEKYSNGPFINLRGEMVFLNHGYYTNLNDQQVTLKDKFICRTGDPITTFNCLSFAFYMYWHESWQDGSNYGIACWMDDVSAFITDHSFYELDITKEEPQANDVVCYFAGEEIINAGIIKFVYPTESGNPATDETFVKRLSQYRVESMWGYFGLYDHRGDLCPFVGTYVTKEVTESPATTARYFRRHEKHNFAVVKGSADGNMHTVRCDECGATKKESHLYKSYSILSDGLASAKHKVYCECEASIMEKHTMTTINIGSSPYTYCTKCNWSTFENKIKKKEDILQYLQNSAE